MPTVVEPLAVVVVVAIVVGMFGLFTFQLRGIVFVSASLLYSAAVALLVYVTNRSTETLDRTLIPLFQREDVDAIDAAIDDAHIVNLLGPRAYIGRRRGLAEFLRGDYGAAERHFEIAWKRSNPESRHDLVPPLCRIKYQLKKMRDMRELAEDWVRLERGTGPSAWYFVLAKIESEGIDDEALETLVAEAGVAEEVIDKRVRDEVFQRMSARAKAGDETSEEVKVEEAKNAEANATV